MTHVLYGAYKILHHGGSGCTVMICHIDFPKRAWSSYRAQLQFSFFPRWMLLTENCRYWPHPVMCFMEQCNNVHPFCGCWKHLPRLHVEGFGCQELSASPNPSFQRRDPEVIGSTSFFLQISNALRLKVWEERTLNSFFSWKMDLLHK